MEQTKTMEQVTSTFTKKVGQTTYSCQYQSYDGNGL